MKKTVAFCFLLCIAICLENLASVVHAYALGENTEIEMYSGPGENYCYIGTLSESKINSIVREERGWFEIEYNYNRMYAEKKKLHTFDESSLPLVSTTELYGPGLRPVQIFFKDFEYELTCNAPIYSGPYSSANLITELPAGTIISILLSHLHP